MNINEGKIIYIRIDELGETLPKDFHGSTLLHTIAFDRHNRGDKSHPNLIKITVRRQRDNYKFGMDRAYIFPCASPSVFRLLRAVESELKKGHGQTRHTFDSRFIAMPDGLDNSKHPLWAEYYRLAFSAPSPTIKRLLASEVLTGKWMEVQMLSNWEIVLSLTPKGYQRRMDDYETVKAQVVEAVQFDNDLLREFAELTSLTLADAERWGFTTALWFDDVSGRKITADDVIDRTTTDPEPNYICGDLYWDDPAYALRFWWETLLTADYAVLRPYYMGNQATMEDQAYLALR